MSAAPPDRFSALPGWLAAAFGASGVEITALNRLSGGAIQENWRLDATFAGGAMDGARRWVLRTDAPSSITTSHGRAEEYAILSVARAAGVAAPAPVMLCTDRAVIGAPFFLMERAAGTADARRITRDPELPRFGPALAETLGGQLARLHAVTPPHAALPFLAVPEGPPALARIARYRADLDALAERHPVLEFALNWLETNAPPANAAVLCHTDFRTGNYMVESGRLTAILDWEFASWSDPDEDIGWFLARCWRFGNDALKAGGIASMEPFIDGYERVAGRSVNRSALPYWQVMAELRWAVIALQQGGRCASGTEISQELALSGIMAPEMELNMLNLIDAMGKAA